jgi:hypothetical protein
MSDERMVGLPNEWGFKPKTVNPVVAPPQPPTNKETKFMKSKVVILMSVALISLMLTLAVSAQRKNDKPNTNPGLAVKPKKLLTCSPGQGKDVSTPLNVKNPTAQDLAAGTVIYWTAKVNGGGTANDKQTTTTVLKKNSGNEVSLLGPPGNLSSCQAWTY